MEISHLRILLAIRELGSLTNTGKRLNLTPSAVFCQIRQLEEQVGQKLYERSGNSLVLTDAGTQLARHAEKIIEAHDSAFDSIRESGKNSIVRIGCGPQGSVRIVPYLIRAFKAAHPSTHVRLFTADDECLLGHLGTGLLDVVLITLPVNTPGLTEEPLWSFEQVIVLPPAANGEEQQPKLEGLKSHPFIAFRRGPVIALGFEELCRDLGFDPNVVVENDEPDSIKTLIGLGMGISYLPIWSVAEDVSSGALRILHTPSRRRENYGLVYRRSILQPRVIRDVEKVAVRWTEWWPLASCVEPAVGTSAAR